MSEDNGGSQERLNMKLKSIHSWLMIAVVAIILLPSCSHIHQKDLCDLDSTRTHVKIVFDWSQVVEKADPEGMVLFFYPVDGGKPMRYDLPGKEGGVIELPVGKYNILFYNNDTEANLYGNIEEFEKHRAFTRTVALLSKAFGNAVSTAPRGADTDKQRLVGSPEQMWGGPYRDIYELDSDACELCKKRHGKFCNDTDEETNILVLTPRKYVREVTVIGRNIIGADRAREVKGALTGMSSDINIKTRQPGEEQVTQPFEVVLDREKAHLNAHFYTFGHPDEEGKHYLDLYFVMEDGQKVHRRFDVTDQVRNAPDPWHIVIIIEELLLPPVLEDDSGLDPVIDEWQTEEVDIILH